MGDHVEDEMLLVLRGEATLDTKAVDVGLVQLHVAGVVSLVVAEATGGHGFGAMQGVHWLQSKG